jgi:hypothetical protein
MTIFSFPARVTKIRRALHIWSNAENARAGLLPICSFCANPRDRKRAVPWGRGFEQA